MTQFKRQSVQANQASFQWRSPPLINPQHYDPVFYGQMLRLHRFNLCGRWAFVLLLWLVLGSLSIWQLWPAIELMIEYFTWAALRYTLAFQPFAALGLMMCVGPTIGLLFWQSRNILLGLPKHDVQRLEKTVGKVREQGTSHPLWHWVCGTEAASSTFQMQYDQAQREWNHFKQVQPEQASSSQAQKPSETSGHGADPSQSNLDSDSPDQIDSSATPGKGFDISERSPNSPHEI